MYDCVKKNWAQTLWSGFSKAGGGLPPVGARQKKYAVENRVNSKRITSNKVLNNKWSLDHDWNVQYSYNSSCNEIGSSGLI